MSFKKVFAPIAAVGMASALVLSMAVPVSAVDISGTITYTPSGSTVGTYVAASSNVCTFSPVTNITATSNITLTFPVGTVLANIVAGDFTIQQAASGTSSAGTATAPSAIDVNAGARTITFTVAAGSLSSGGDSDGLGVVTIATSGTAAGDEIRHPTTITTAGTFSVATSVGDNGSISNVVFVHDTATKFVILDPTDGTVDAAITVTVQLQDQFGNIVTTGADKDKDVTLTADGSATGAGVVDIVNGVGTINVSDQVVETVNLGLTDHVPTGFDVTSTQDVDFAHGAANKFVILDPTDGTVDAAITVTVQLQDQYGNIVTTGADKDKDVTLTAGGSATGAGLVDIVNGVGTIAISDQVAETVNLGLSDTEGTGFDDSSTQDVVFAAGILPPAEGDEWVPPPPAPEPGVTDVSDIVDKRGVFTESATPESEDGKVELDIKKDATGKTKEGKPLSEISIAPMAAPPVLPAGASTVGFAYNLGPSGATFDPAITITFTYDPDDIPEGVNEEDLVLAYWGSEWVVLKGCTVDPATNTISAPLSHFTPFAVIAYHSPAAFTISPLTVSPAEVNVGESVTISITVTNTGDLSGDYEAVLKINGAVIATKKITLPGDASQKVTFTTTKDAAGTYTVGLGGLSGTFTIKAPPAPAKPAPPAPAKPAPPPPAPPAPAPVPPAKPLISWPMTVGAILAVIVVGLLIFFLLRRRRRY